MRILIMKNYAQPSVVYLKSNLKHICTKNVKALPNTQTKYRNSHYADFGIFFFSNSYSDMKYFVSFLSKQNFHSFHFISFPIRNELHLFIQYNFVHSNKYISWWEFLVLLLLFLYLLLLFFLSKLNEIYFWYFSTHLWKIKKLYNNTFLPISFFVKNVVFRFLFVFFFFLIFSFFFLLFVLAWRREK